MDEDRVIDIAKDYADEECVGEFGEILDTGQEDDLWIVEFRTHTFADEYDHRVKITDNMGNVISHDRHDRLD